MLSKTYLLMGLLCLLLWSSYAESSVVVAISNLEMVKRARLIVRGKVLSQRVHRVGSNQQVVTDSVIRVSHFLKGKTVVNLVTVRVEGGDVKEMVRGVKQVVHHRVGGSAELSMGEDVVLFLEAPKASKLNPMPTYFQVLNMGLGKFSVYKDTKTSKEMIARQSNVPVQIARGHKGHIHAQASHLSPKPITFSTFLFQVKGHLQTLSRPSIVHSHKPMVSPKEGTQR